MPTEPFGKREGCEPLRDPPRKHGQIIQRLLEGMQMPQKMTIMHCKSHPSRETPENIGYGLADKAVEKAAGGDILLALPKKYWHLDKEAAN